MPSAQQRPLTDYRRKRDFGRTAEPDGEAAVLPHAQRYVMHLHHASHEHFDLRLEENGVLRSWALPRGPSFKRGEKRLAVEVEDHPIAYGSFEGTIPKGEYGGGTVMLWDAGSWAATGKRDADRIDLTLEGAKLKGTWTLVRSGSKPGKARNNWLLIKRGHDDVDPAGVHDRSIHSGRTMAQIARGAAFAEPAARPDDEADLVPSAIPGARRSAMPAESAPELPTLTATAPEGDNWVHEIKFDGYRMIGRIAGGKAALRSRNGHDWTARFAAQAAQLATLLAKDAVVDGEMVSIGPAGSPNFGALQDMIGTGKTGAAVLYLFDLLHLDGYDLRKATLLDRKLALRQLLRRSRLGAEGSAIRFSDHVVGNGGQFFRHACDLGIEGSVAKRADSHYSGRRTSAWLKIKCLQDDEFVVGGFTPPSGSRTGFGALLLGRWEGPALRYQGRVGTGFSLRQLAQLHSALLKDKQAASPFDGPVPGARGVTWVTPGMVVDVAFGERTSEGRLRHPTFRGVREDRNPEEIVMPAAAARASTPRPQRVPVRGSDVVEGVRITHPERVVFPDTGLTKLELARFYADIQDWLLPQLANRLLSLVRCPDGSGAACFFQKHLLARQAPHVPRQDFTQSTGAKPFAYVQSISHVIELVQSGVIEFHPFGSRIDRVEQPDMMVFDLDPSPGVQWEDILVATRGLRERLEALGLGVFLRTTGGKGVHLVVPLRPGLDWDAVKAFSKAVSERHAADAPTRLTTLLAKTRRRDRIFIDYLRNGRGATAIASYSTRARPGAPVAVPVGWDEVGASLRPDQYTVANLRQRLDALKHDPWADFDDARVAISARMRKAVGLRA